MHPLRSRSVRLLRPGALLVALGVATCPAAGQDQPLRRLDPVREDVGALSTSLHVPPGDLLAPSGFEHVYEVPGHPGLKMRVDGGLYAVFRDSVYVMDRFGFAHAHVSNDTVFFIGRPSEEALAALDGPVPPWRPEEPEPDGTSSQRINPRIDAAAPGTAVDGAALNLASALRIDTSIAADSPAPDGPPLDIARTISRRPDAEGDGARRGPAIVTDDAYRARRLRALMERAATARQSREAG